MFANKFYRFLVCYRKQIIILFLICFAAIITAVFSVYKINGVITIDKISDKALVAFLKGEKSRYSIFFSYSFNALLVCSIAIFLNFKPWMAGINIIMLIIYCYTFSFNLTCLIVLFSFAGVLNVLFILLPCEFLILTFLILVSAVAIKRNFIIKKYGCCRMDSYCNFNYYHCYAFLMGLILIVIILKCFLLPIINVTIVTAV